MRLIGLTLLVLCVAACNQPRPQNRPHPEVLTPEAGVPPPKPSPSAPRPPPARIDPKSKDAALELVQGFAKLLNGGHLDEAYMLLGSGAGSRKEFASRWAQIEALQVKVGPAGDEEGAAGSVYLSVPLEVRGSAAGKAVRRSPTVILRRVNDVPGSTDAQRLWHIERIDWSAAG